MNSLKKKKLLNLIMVVAIVAIIVAGVLSVGSLQGRFDKPENEQLTFISSDKSGSVSIERAGISYSLKNGVHIRDGDRIETLNASTVTLYLDEMNCVRLEENTQTNIILLAGNSGLTTQVSDLSPEWLNDFAISCVKIANEHAALCFTNSELDAVTAAREQEQQQAQQQESETKPATQNTKENTTCEA